MLDPDIYWSVLDSLAVGVYLVDRERRILLWNHGAERITGYLAQEVLGRTCSDNLLMHCDESCTELRDIDCPLLGTIHDLKPREADLFIRHKDGQRIPVHVRAVPIRNSDGVVIGAAESFDERILLPHAELHANSRAVSDHADYKTGILNEQSIREHLDATILDLAEHHVPFSVLSIAIDRLDEFHESHGAIAADAIIAVVAHTLARNVHPLDLVGRWPGRRFIAIIADCPGNELEKISERLKRIVDLTGIPWWGDRISPTISIGGTAAQADDTAESLIERANEALETSLSEGGDRVTIR